MRYDKDHKAQTRAAVIENASQRFRRDGIQAVGIASLMADTGLTHGGFYAHFGSKDELVATAIGKAFEGTFESLQKVIDNAGNRHPAESLIDAYLSPLHRDHPGQGCAAAALGAEVARLDTQARQEFSRHIERLIELIGQQLDQYKDKELRRQTAHGIFATMVGALQMARAAASPGQSMLFIEAGKAAALASAKDFGLR